MTDERFEQRPERGEESAGALRQGNGPARRKEKISARLWVLAGLGGTIIALFVLSVQWKAAQKITGVAVTGNLMFPEETIRARADVPIGGLMDTVGLSAISERLTGDPYISRAVVGRTYPGTVTINVEERIPVVSFHRNRAILHVDGEGVVLPRMDSDVPLDLPFVTGIPELMRAPVGRPVDSDEYFEALGILQAALETDTLVYRLISEVDMNDGGDIVIHSVDLGVPIKFGRGDARRKFTLLGEFWTKFALEEGPEKLDYLDLRFSDQVVAKWNTKPRKTFNQSSL